MPQAGFENLWTTLEQLLPSAATGELLVAFSGGLDSTVLLHALTARTPFLVAEARRARVRAVLRRVRPALAGEQLRLADLEMDIVRHKVRRAGRRR